MAWVKCNYCNGHGFIITYDPKKKVNVRVTCPGCSGSGKINTGLV